jgi:anti-sigma B factor antagonist
MISERTIGGVTILDISGRITVQDGAAEFREAIRQLVRRGRLNLVINLREVPYIDSTALGEIVRASTTATRLGGALKLLNVHGRVHDLLVTTRLLSVFDSFDTESDAAKSFGSVAFEDAHNPPSH